MKIENSRLIINFGLFKLKIKPKKIEKLIKKFFKTDSKKIIFSNFHGGGFGCNPKYIAQEIIKRKLPYRLLWLVDNKSAVINESFPEEIELVNRMSFRKIFEFATAKLWIVNTTLQVLDIKKRDEQIYLQTGHGSLGIKKIGLDDSNISDKKKKLINKEAKELNYFISNSGFETEVYSRGFCYDKEKIKEYGHARNDIFFKDISQIKQKVYSYYKLNENIKTLLYVPTFRKDGRYECFDLDYDNLVKTLNEKFGTEWKILVRFHPRTQKHLSKFFNSENENVINATYYDDIQELLASSDIAITDYSSCIFDFILTRRPAFIFATDIEHFDQDQGCYYPLSATPFPVATSNKELFDAILNFDYDKYKKEAEEFIKGKNCIEDGHAAERIVDLIEDIMKGKA